MKKIYKLMSILALASIAAACAEKLPEPENPTPENPDQEQEEPTPEPVVGAISLSSTEAIVLSDEGGSQEITFAATLEWTAESSAEFVTVEPASGEAGDAVVTVTVGANEDYDPRTATVTLTCGEDVKTVNLTQKQKGALLLTESAFTVAAEGQVITVLAKANSNVTYSITADAQSWITPAVDTKGLIDYSFNFQIAANESEQPRTGQIVFSNEAGNETVTIEQAGAEPKVKYIAISDAASLKEFAACVTAGSTALEAQVTASFDASTLAWTPVENYTGVFEGNNQTITGLTQPLFGTFAGTVKNLTLESTINASAADDINWGIFAKVANEGALIENCTAKGAINYTPAAAIENDCHIAGIVGNYYGGTITGCTNLANISFTSPNVQHAKYINLAGIVGRTQKEDNVDIVGQITNCTNKGSLTYSAETTNTIHIAGIVGRVAMPLTNCHSSEGTISYSGASYAGKLYVGGIVGYTKEGITISDCSSAMALNIGGAFEATADNYFGFGGVIGNVANNDATLSNCSNTGDITLSQKLGAKGYTFLGGVAGRSQGVITGCSNSGTVSFTGMNNAQNPYIGGIVGTNSNVSGDRIHNCTNSGNIVVNAPDQTNKNFYVGGIAGRSYGAVTATNSGNIEIKGLTCTTIYAGGLTALAENGSLTGTNTGNLTIAEGCKGNDNIVAGGIVGLSKAAITACINEGEIFNFGSTEVGNIEIAGIVGVSKNLTLTGSHNAGYVKNEGNAGAGIMVGGVAGLSDACTFKTCYNTGEINNYGAATDIANDKVYGKDGGYEDFAVDVCLGGIAGYLVNANTLSGTESEYNYNSGLIYEESESKWVAMGGIAGYTKGISDFSYTKNLSGGVYVKGNLRNKTYLGGVLGCAGDAVTMDYASNAATITYRSVTIESACWTGGILGGWYSAAKSVESTITGCTNSGMIDCSNAGGNGSNMAAASKSVTGFSYVGGICGVGDCTNKKFINCTNSGRIAVYNQLKTRLGGILGYSSLNPDGCVNKGRINYCRWNTQSNGGNGEIGGVVGYMNIETPTNLTNDANVRSTGSSPNCYTGGIVGRTNTNTVGFLNCKVGSSGDGEQTISGAGENAFGNTAAGLFCSDGNAGHAWDFTGCVILKGTKCSKLEITEENLAEAIVGRNHATEITNAPTIVDSF